MCVRVCVCVCVCLRVCLISWLALDGEERGEEDASLQQGGYQVYADRYR